MAVACELVLRPIEALEIRGQLPHSEVSVALSNDIIGCIGHCISHSLVMNHSVVHTLRDAIIPN